MMWAEWRVGDGETSLLGEYIVLMTNGGCVSEYYYNG